MSNSLLWVVVLAAVSTGFGVVAQPAPAAAEKGNTHLVPMGHVATDQAEREARRTLPIFVAKWRARPAGYDAFRLNAGFRTDDGRGIEHMWFEPLSISADGMVTGRLSNTPAAISRLSEGSEVKVPTAKISDWMYVKDRKMFGQFTMRAQLELASPEQRAQFQAMLSPTPLEPGDR